eukprot:776533-Pelagomonas_calceolata.AAC.2
MQGGERIKQRLRVVHLRAHHQGCACNSNSLRSMRAPAVLSFLHMLSAALALWVASSYELPTQRLQIDKLQLNMQGVKGAAVPAAIGALQELELGWEGKGREGFDGWS